MKTSTKEKNVKRILTVSHNEVDFKEFDFTDYNYIVKATDKFMSGWGSAKNTTAKTILFCKTLDQVRKAIPLMKKDDFKYCNWYNINYEKPSFNSKNIFTIRIIEHAQLWK